MRGLQSHHQNLGGHVGASFELGVHSVELLLVVAVAGLPVEIALTAVNYFSTESKRRNRRQTVPFSGIIGSGIQIRDLGGQVEDGCHFVC
mgnify:CR=1 FL=1